VKPPVLLTCRIPSALLARLNEACDVERLDGPVAPSVLADRVRGKHALICLLTDEVGRAVIDAGQALRIIANIAVGYNNIDVAHARSRGIVVTNTPDVLTEATAEFTWGLILAAARRIAEGERLLRRGAWKGWALDFLLGMELRGKQLGVVGMGRIGRAVAAKAPAFGMRVAFAEQGGGDAASPVEHAIRLSLDELLVSSDVVTLHVPLTPATRHLIDRRALARMKRTAILVNTSRGPAVDEDALIWALEERLIAGAALDVYEREPEFHPKLLEFENVVLAPHIASATRETRTAMAELAVGNVLNVLSGQPPLTPVTLD
jgi:glyoxylate reductase